MPAVHLQRGLILGALLVVLSCVTTLSLASRRILAEQSAYGAAPSVDKCTPRVLNASAVLSGTNLAVSPLPGAYDASAHTQISLLGAPLSAISHLSVTGTHSGRHSGRLMEYSQDDGASFLPSRPFLPGEAVKVRGSVFYNGRPRAFSWVFVVAHADNGLYKYSAPVHEIPSEVQHFRSAPTLNAPLVAVTTRAAQATPGDIFEAPYNGPGPSGPMIFDEEGNLVWFDPLPANLFATNLQVQQYGPEPVLTWWQGHIPPQGFGQGEEIIDDSSYHEIGTVHAGNGFEADLHEFHLSAAGTAVVTVFEPIECDLANVGGPRHAAVTDTGYQEIDIATGLVRREWTSLDHVGVWESYSTATGASDEWPFDYFHINSVDQQPNGRTMISARNTWALYELNSSTGQVLERIGGKYSNFKLAGGAATAFQHDATVLEGGTVAVFDNGGVPTVHPQSRALLLSLNTHAATDSVLAQFVHPSPPLSSGSQGNVQVLEGGNLFVGWGSQPWFSEFSASGQLLYDAHMHGSYQTYRGYRFGWTGAPSQPPAVAVTKAHSGALSVYASWNGDTRTVSWRVLAGASAHTLQGAGEAPRTGFETVLGAPAGARYVAVQALGAHQEVLGTSPAIAG